MHTKVVFRGAKTLASLGCAVLRFNFRGVGRSEGSFGAAEGEIEDFGAALDVMATRYPGAELWTAGLSFGAYVSMAAGVADNRVTRLLGIAPPLQRYDFSMLVRSTKPKYFIQGERDEICPLDDMKSFFESLSEPKQLIVVPGADHLFVGQLDDLTQAIETLFGR
jgi:alpha/beta superfamily hydrolase